ncbi:MAG: NAD(P)/FAD-dependent oxidoreductase [Parachlamydiales bacterium]|nr:NAD(P)/FAD-dependent oxidoreductase [Parachlamydiales bacterium]
MSPKKYSRKIVVVGGGPAGFFAALAAKTAKPSAKVVLLEQSEAPLQKVKVSGGGRCNVTHACFNPVLLAKNYPRGGKELIPLFEQFQPLDMVRWFSERKIFLKTEKDGRMFPNTDSSDTIMRCFLEEAKKCPVEIVLNTELVSVRKVQDRFVLDCKRTSFVADRLILATGSSRKGWEIVKSLGHTIEEPVPSLFSFQVPFFLEKNLAGISIDKVALCIRNTSLSASGPLLVTHWGVSGPVVLTLSSLAARYFGEHRYKAELIIDWVPSLSKERLHQGMERLKKYHPKKHLGTARIVPLSNSLWRCLCEKSSMSPDTPLGKMFSRDFLKLSDVLKNDRYSMTGKSHHKAEFVTCGGVRRSEITSSMESMKCPHLFFCGEMIDIDGITGGFNFQNAWTTGWIAGKSAVR